METLLYFLDKNNEVLLAYERSSDFLMAYNFARGEWLSCEISFMQLRHERELTEITSDTAFAMTNGSLPNEEYRRYLDILKLNGSV